MIARVWHGVTHASQAEAYAGYLERTGITDSRATEGNRGVTVLRRVEGESAHFLFVSFWESEEAIRRFAGDEIERARYYPEDASYLLELEVEVTHYEVVEGP
jgi:heme-degrading monooxygenase HmoA